MPEHLKIDGKLNIHIFCQTHTVFDGVADKVLLPAVGGNMMILRDRAPLFTSLDAGVLWVYNKGFNPVAFYIHEGVAEIRRNICSVLAWGIEAGLANEKWIAEQKQQLTEKIAKAHLDIQKDELQKQMDFLHMLEIKPKNLIPTSFE